jgi:hypothetical protein
MKNIIYILVLLISIGSISCGDGECNVETDSLITCTFLVEDATLKADLFLDSLSVYSTEWLDTINKWDLEDDASFEFSLSPNDTITKVIIASKATTELDTITFQHQNKVVLLSTECGFVVNFEIDTVISTYHLIDSISLVNDEITSEENGLIEIYYL